MPTTLIAAGFLLGAGVILRIPTMLGAMRRRWRDIRSIGYLNDASRQTEHIYTVQSLAQRARRLARGRTMLTVVVYVGLAVGLSFAFDANAAVVAVGVCLLTMVTAPAYHRRARQDGGGWMMSLVSRRTAVLSAVVTSLGLLLLFFMIWTGAGLVARGAVAMGIALMVSALAVDVVAMWLYYWVHRWQHRGRNPEDLPLPSAQFVYLRPFNADRLRIRSGIHSGLGATLLGVNYVRLEEMITAVGFRGAAVAIGRPGERAPQMGAFRSYEPDEVWQEKVRQLTAQATGVLVLTGDGQGLAWEIGHLRQAGHLPKTLFILPPRRRGRRLQQILDGALADLGLDSSAVHGIPVRFIVGLGLGRDGQLHIYVSDDRDWAAYLALSIIFTSRMERSGISGQRIGDQRIGDQRIGDQKIGQPDVFAKKIGG